LIAVMAITGVFFFASFGKEEAPTAGPLTATSPTKEFRSAYGFTVTYPENWLVDNSRKDAPAEFIREPNGRAFFAMQTHIDPRITKPGELALVYKDLEDAFRNDGRYLLEKVEWENKDKNTPENSFFAAGSYAEGGKNWKFKEITIMSKSGLVLTLRGMTLKEYAGEYGPMMDRIFFSVAPAEGKASQDVSVVTKEQAVAKVGALSEVVEYKNMLIEAGKKALLEAEDGESDWNVHVFEIVGEGEDAHTATFGWYRVNKKTGAVEKEI